MKKPAGRRDIDDDGQLLVTTTEAAALLKVPASTVRRWAADYPAELPRRGHYRGRTTYGWTDLCTLAARLRTTNTRTRNAAA